MRSKERLACVNPEAKSVCIKTLATHVKDVFTWQSKMVDETVQAKQVICPRIFLLESSLQAERDCVDRVVVDKNELVDWLRKYDCMRRRL